MAGGGYPVAYRGSTSAKSTTTGGVALKAPKPDVQHTGPKPFLDYPMGEWDKIQRRRSGGLPKTKRLRLPLAAGKLLWRLNDWQAIISTLEQVEQTVEVLQGTKVAYFYPSGWSMCPDYQKCALPPAFTSWGAGGCTSSVATGCLSLQAFNNSHGLGEFPTTSTFTRVFFCAGDPTAARTTFTRLVRRVVSTALSVGPTAKINHLYVVEVPKVDWVPNIVPMELPLLQPAADPSPVPYRVIPSRVIDPNADPTEQTHFGYSIDPSTNYGVAPGLAPDPGTSPEPPEDPGTVIEVPPDGPPQTKPPTVVAAHRAAPPARGTKEKKLVLGAGKLVGGLVNLVTESADFINAVHKALPPKYQAKRTWDTDPLTGRRFTHAPSVYEKTKAILEHSDHVDWGQAAKNAINNAAQDAFFGRVGNKLKQANKKGVPGLRTNYGLGPAL